MAPLKVIKIDKMASQLKPNSVMTVNTTKYKVIELIAEGNRISINEVGAYGLVYKIQRVSDGRFFAVKRMTIQGRPSHMLTAY